MQQSKLNHSYIERIIYSQQFRSLQDKTQLFYPSQKQRVRTRLTHTMEVRTIAHKIAYLLNEKIKEYNITIGQAHNTETQLILQADIELIDAIAFAHDIGHTPFGHIGERTIDAVVSGKDTLGGLIHQSEPTTMRFKHNSNAVRILVDLGVEDWRISEGALSHTKIFYKNDYAIYNNNPYNPFANSAYNKLIHFIFSQNMLNIRDVKKLNPPSLTLEGQIVAVADEIAQRAADLGDAKIKARYLDNIENMFGKHIGVRKCPDSISTNPYSRLEWVIFTTMTEDIAQQTFNNLKIQVPVEVKYCGISHAVYKEKVAAFSPSMKSVNDELDAFVTSFLAQSEEVRESDSRSKYIIRQLYKAYVNDVTLLPDAFIENHLNRIANGSDFEDTFTSVNSSSCSKASCTFGRIRKKGWYVESDITNGFSKKLLDINLVKDYVDILKNNNAKANSEDPKVALLFDAFLLDVGFYIAGMTNTEAFEAYNKIYGHTL